MIDIALIIQSAQNYFDEIGGGGFTCNTPFILQKEEGVGRYILEFTAAITISGKFDGAVYVTLPREMVDALVTRILGESGAEEDLVDMAGELVNTVTGNLRQALGDGFVISVPMVIRGQNVYIDLPRLVSPIYLVPCRWESHEFYLCVGLDKIAGL
jgi:chemotaxis protein CheX